MNEKSNKKELKPVIKADKPEKMSLIKFRVLKGDTESPLTPSLYYRLSYETKDDSSIHKTFYEWEKLLKKCQSN